MQMSANFTIIERPIRIFSLVSSVRTALRARARQYELRGVMEGLRQADQRKTVFLATLAHELRNPLAPLSTALSLLQRKSFSAEEARPHYQMMERQVQHMVRLIDDLMEVSRITRGKIELKLEVRAHHRRQDGPQAGVLGPGACRRGRGRAQPAVADRGPASARADPARREP